MAVIKEHINVRDDRLLDGLSPVVRLIDLALILSPDLKSRMRAQDLKLLIENSEEKEIELVFQGVRFATRSFIDEFYNLFLKNPKANTFQVKLTNA